MVADGKTKYRPATPLLSFFRKYLSEIRETHSTTPPNKVQGLELTASSPQVWGSAAGPPPGPLPPAPTHPNVTQWVTGGPQETSLLPGPLALHLTPRAGLGPCGYLSLRPSRPDWQLTALDSENSPVCPEGPQADHSPPLPPCQACMASSLTWRERSPGAPGLCVLSASSQISRNMFQGRSEQATS